MADIEELHYYGNGQVHLCANQVILSIGSDINTNPNILLVCKQGDTITICNIEQHQHETENTFSHIKP